MNNTVNDPNVFQMDMRIIFLHIKDIVIGIFGGLVAYFIKYKRDHDYAQASGEDLPNFELPIMVINMIIGAFIAYIAGDLMPLDLSGRDFYLGLISISSYSLAMTIESKGIALFLKRIFGSQADSIIKDINENQEPQKPKRKYTKRKTQDDKK